MNEVSSVQVNFLGKLFRKPSVNANSDTLWLSLQGKEVAHYPLRAMRSFAHVDESVLGSQLRFSSDGIEIKTGFLQKRATANFLRFINQSISKYIQDYLRECFSEFDALAINHYPRDTWSVQIESMLSELHQYYVVQSETWKKYLPASVIERVEMMLKFYPLDMASLREYHESYQLNKREVFFDIVETNPLTAEQRLGVLRSNDRNMVLAAAGTGKTSVMVAKVLDLIDRKLAQPSEIIVLAYNRAAANELKERLESKAVNGNVTLLTKPYISTFHALGRQILRDAGISTQ